MADSPQDLSPGPAASWILQLPSSAQAWAASRPAPG